MKSNLPQVPNRLLWLAFQAGLLLSELTSDYHIEESGLFASIVQKPDNLQQILVVGHAWIINLFDKRADIWQ